jgi:hypothetical protein
MMKFTFVQPTRVLGMRKSEGTWKSFLRVEATKLLDVPSVGEFLVVLVRQLVGAGLEHFDDDIGPLP